MLKEISPEYSLEGLMRKLKLQYFGLLMRRADSLEKKIRVFYSWKTEGMSRKGWQDEMAGWHHQLIAHESEQTPGSIEVQGSLTCCSPWGCKESDTTEGLNNMNFLQHYWLPPLLSLFLCLPWPHLNRTFENMPSLELSSTFGLLHSQRSLLHSQRKLEVHMSV